MFPGVARQSKQNKQRTRSISKNNRYPFSPCCFLVVQTKKWSKT
ncbi:hypothetical protein CSC02_4105 [Enterobacter hormaechei subsp. hoffmannii]|nr:hypothetical protein CSC02_4105 [Enterobacter hormaechei subsp. hoffmannii]